MNLKFPMYWSITTKVSYIQRAILIHSIIYYEYDSNIISDKKYDKLSHILVEYQNSLSKEQLKCTEYGYVFKDFDGSTGFDLVPKLSHEDKDYLTLIASHVLDRHKKAN